MSLVLEHSIYMHFPEVYFQFRGWKYLELLDVFWSLRRLVYLIGLARPSTTGDRARDFDCVYSQSASSLSRDKLQKATLERSI